MPFVLALILVTSTSMAATSIFTPNHNLIHIISATYGLNCGVPEGNASQSVSQFCENKHYCFYRIDALVLGNPIPECTKDFQVRWHCGNDRLIHRNTLPASKGEVGVGRTILITCGEH